jgi:hypothetical protein
LNKDAGSERAASTPLEMRMARRDFNGLTAGGGATI